MEALKKLQHLSVVSKVVQELENHFGLNDKVLAEFVIDLANGSSSYQDFKKKLDTNGANFSDQFATNLYKIITKMDPKNIGVNKNETTVPGQGKPDSQNLKSNRDVARTIEEECVHFKMLVRPRDLLYFLGLSIVLAIKIDVIRKIATRIENLIMIEGIEEIVMTIEIIEIIETIMKIEDEGIDETVLTIEIVEILEIIGTVTMIEDERIEETALTIEIVEIIETLEIIEAITMIEDERTTTDIKEITKTIMKYLKLR